MTALAGTQPTAFARRPVVKIRAMPSAMPQLPTRPAATTRAGLFLWVPVLMSMGIGLWFCAPGLWRGLALWLVAALALASMAVFWGAPRLAQNARIDWKHADMLRMAAAAIAFVAAGIGLSVVRSAMVAAPVMEWRYYGPVEGRLIGIDRSARDRIRLTLDQVVLRNTTPERVPRRVRLSLMNAAAEGEMPVLGQRIMLTGHLGPPPGPAAPGSFDFRQLAWFEGLGAIGYSRTPIMTVAPPEGGMWGMHRARMAISRAMQERIGGQEGAVASALMTGDRSGISEATNEIMRASNLYHIISISGLHMGMLAGFVYNGLRLALVFVVALGGVLPGPMHKLAAGAALGAAAIYLWLSGGGVATERSFVMVAVMLGAILADRRAISLRTLAVAAVIIMIYSPDAVTTPGFQMSFAATAALILSYGPWLRVANRIPWWLRPVCMLLLSSLVAGIAASPIAAAHFNRMAQYGMVANLLVVPVMGTLVMPAGVIGALLAPLGLADPALWVMGLGTRWMLFVAAEVSSWGAAVTAIPMPPWQVLPMLCYGSILMILCWRRGQSWRRFDLALLSFGLGGVMLVIATLTWIASARPTLLIASEGEAVGLMTSEGRAISKSSGGGFAVSNWLLEDGDTAIQEDAAARPGWSGDRRDRWIDWPEAGLTVWHFTGKGSAERALAACQRGTLIVTNESVAADARNRIGDCHFFDPRVLRDTGALAVDVHAGRLEITSTADFQGDMPWSRSR